MVGDGKNSQLFSFIHPYFCGRRIWIFAAYLAIQNKDYISQLPLKLGVAT